MPAGAGIPALRTSRYETNHGPLSIKRKTLWRRPARGRCVSFAAALLVQAILAALLGMALLAAAAFKLLDTRTGTAVGAESFGLRGRAARSVWLALAALEAGLAAGVLAGATPAAWWAAAGTFVAFAGAQAIAIAAGRGGAPCGCFGARGRISWGSVARAALLAAGAALLAALGTRSPPPLPVALAAAGLASAVVLRTRRPAGALDVAGEGPPLGTSLDLGDGVRLALFTSPWLPSVPLARPARRAARRQDHRRGRRRRAVGPPPTSPARRSPSRWPPTAPSSRRARSTPARSSQSVAGAAPARAHATAEHPRRSSRRRLLQTASAAVAVLTAGRLAGALVKPGDAEAFHFCGHIYTTDGCPHLTGLPRIDRHGFPPRAKDGRPVDDLGRLVDAAGAPIDEAGLPLLDPHGRPQPPARRRRVCTAVGKRYRIEVRTDGSWYRCCDGHVRKLIDCCTHEPAAHQRRPRAEGLLLRPPARLLRHVLPDERAVLIALAIAALVAGVAGAWSPCGFSMVDTLAPHGYAQRMRVTAVACLTFAAGALAGGVATFGGLALLGGALGPSHGAAVAITAALLLAAAIGDAGGRRIVPQVRRQVPEAWRRVLPVPLAAGLYGVLLGLGFTTFVLSFAVYGLAAACLALGEPAVGLVVGLAFATGRIVPVVVLAPLAGDRARDRRRGGDGRAPPRAAHHPRGRRAGAQRGRARRRARWRAGERRRPRDAADRQRH